MINGNTSDKALAVQLFLYGEGSLQQAFRLKG
jgi:hypothetical protein